jgi:hypothetical protein
MKDYLSRPELNFLFSIVVPLTALGVSWGIMTAKLDSMDRRLVSAETKIEVQAEISQDISINLATIGKDIQYIKAALDKHLNY